MKKEQNARWFDEEDFTPEHDQMMVDLMTNFKKYVEIVCPPHHSLAGSPIHENLSVLKGEVGLSGFPVVYPDALVEVRYTYDHTTVLGFSGVQVTPTAIGVVGCCEVCLKDEILGVINNSTDLMCKVEEAKALWWATDNERKRFPEMNDAEWAYKFRTWDREYSTSFNYNRDEILRVLQKIDDACNDRLKYIPIEPCYKSEGYNLLIEIKPRINSFGSVLRQLQVYKSRRPDSQIVLITKDARYDSLFEEQGFKVIHPDLPELPVDKTAAKAILQATLME